MDKPPLKEYQRENVEWIQRVRRGLLADEPGLGKSRSALEGTAGAERVLIVAPSMVLETGVWHEEVERWGSDDTRYFAAPYSQLNRRKKTERGGTKPVNVLRPEYKGHWDAVIFDECHIIKGRDSHWTWVAKHLARNSDMSVLLTGTPIPNWAHEVFSLLQVIYPEEGKRGNELGSFWRWAEQWFDTTPDLRFGNRVVGDLLGCTPKCSLRNADDPCVHYIEFAKSNFGDHYMRHLRADHLDLPPLVFRDVAIELAADERHAYGELARQFATEYEGKELLAWSGGAKNVMLDKFTTSPWLLHKEGEPRGGKFERLRADIRRRAGSSPTFVLAHYRDSVEGAAAVARSVGASAGFIHGGTTDRHNAATIRDFKRGRLDVLVGSLETLAEGVTLTVADTAIFLERSYKPSRNTQATYRVHRLGQTKECTIVRYITTDTVDEHKEELLEAKTDRQMRALAAADFARLL